MINGKDCNLCEYLDKNTDGNEIDKAATGERDNGGTH